MHNKQGWLSIGPNKGYSSYNNYGFIGCLFDNS